MSTAISTTVGFLFAAVFITFGGFLVMSFTDIWMEKAFGPLTSLMIVFVFLLSVPLIQPAILFYRIVGQVEAVNRALGWIK